MRQRGIAQIMWRERLASAHVHSTSGRGLDEAAQRGDGVRRGKIRDERGVAMAEFALIAPVLLLIVAGMLGFGRLLFYWVDANHLANEATRWAAVDRNPYGTSLQDYIANAATAEFKNGLRVCLDFPSGGTPQIGDPLRIRVQKPFTFVPIVGISLTVRASSTQRIERFENGTSPTNYAAGNLSTGACT